MLILVLAVPLPTQLPANAPAKEAEDDLSDWPLCSVQDRIPDSWLQPDTALLVMTTEGAKEKVKYLPLPFSLSSF